MDTIYKMMIMMVPYNVHHALLNARVVQLIKTARCASTGLILIQGLACCVQIHVTVKIQHIVHHAKMMGIKISLKDVLNALTIAHASMKPIALLVFMDPIETIMVDARNVLASAFVRINNFALDVSLEVVLMWISIIVFKLVEISWSTIMKNVISSSETS